MVQCEWPGGCGTRTKDQSRLCSRHRRFSGNLWKDNGTLSDSSRRLATTIQMNHDAQDEFSELYQRSDEALDGVPSVTITHNEQIDKNVYYMKNMIRDNVMFWNGEWRTTPYEDDAVIIQAADGHPGDLIVVQKNKEQNIIPQLYMSTRVIRYSLYDRRYNVSDGIGEEYDDTAEAIAQLEIGRRHNQQVTVMLDKSGAETQELFRVTDQKTGQQVAGVLSSQYDLNNSNEIVKRFVPSVPDNMKDSVTDEQVAAINQLAEIRGIIEKHMVLTSKSDKMYLPVGWTERTI